MYISKLCHHSARWRAHHKSHKRVINFFLNICSLHSRVWVNLRLTGSVWRAPDESQPSWKSLTEIQSKSESLLAFAQHFNGWWTITPLMTDWFQQFPQSTKSRLATWPYVLYLITLHQTLPPCVEYKQRTRKNIIENYYDGCFYRDMAIVVHAVILTSHNMVKSHWKVL